MRLLKTSLTLPKDGFTVNIRVRNITAKMAETPVAIAVQPTTDGENVLVVMLLLKLFDVWIKFARGRIVALIGNRADSKTLSRLPEWGEANTS